MKKAATTPDAMFETRIDIPEGPRQHLCALLNQTLADLSDLSSQVHVAHWNVKGRDFYQLHDLFDEIYEELGEFIDMVAERTTALGGYAHGTVRDAAENSVLPEYPREAIEGMEHVAALAERFAHVAAHLRQGIESSEQHSDKSTADLYTELSRAIDKRLWFLEAHLQGKPR